jgi:hypothetical protein
MIQTNLREIDMRDISADRYVASLREMHATVAMINVAGIIASYPTDLPFHYQSPYLTGDSLETIIAACHDADIRVVARTDFSKVRRVLYESHPEWAAVYPEGHIEDYHGNIHVCINGEYQRIYAPLIVQEAITRLPVDGIFFNMGGFITHNYSHEYLGICQCASCRASFREMFGLDLPQIEEDADPVFRRYREFKARCATERKTAMVEAIRAVRPDIAIDRNSIEGSGFARNESNTEIGRPLPKWSYSAADNTALVVTGWPEMAPSNTTVDFLGFPYRHVAVSPPEQELRLWQNLAFCGGLDYYLIGRLDNHRDRSGFASVRRVFSFHEQRFHEVYRGLRPDAEVLLVRGDDLDEYRGWFRILAEHHIFFAAVPADRLAAIDLSSFRVVILPNVRMRTDDETAALDHAAEQGATVLGTFETGMIDARLERRTECSVKAFGIDRVRHTRDDMLSAMLEIGAEEKREVFRSMTDRDLVAIGGEFSFAEYDDGARRYTRLIPPHRYGPPELCYWEHETDLPGVIVNDFGSGTGLHIPWLPGRFYYREGFDNTFVFIGDLLRNIVGVSTVEGDLPAPVTATRSHRESHEDGKTRSITVIQFVNGCGHFGTSYFPPPTLASRHVSVPLRRGVAPTRLTRVSDGREVEFTYDDTSDRVGFDLPELGCYEAFSIE